MFIQSLLWLFTPGDELSASNEEFGVYGDEYTNKRMYLWSNPALFDDTSEVLQNSACNSNAFSSKVLASASILRTDDEFDFANSKVVKPRLSKSLDYLQTTVNDDDEQSSSSNEQDFYDQISCDRSSPASANDDFQYYQSTDFEAPENSEPPQPHETEV
jgi:hypothetical protein